MRQACSEGPQTITLRGEDAVVVLSAVEYAALRPAGRSLYDIVRSSPVREEDIDTIFARGPQVDNRPSLFDFDD